MLAMRMRARGWVRAVWAAASMMNLSLGRRVRLWPSGHRGLLVAITGSDQEATGYPSMAALSSPSAFATQGDRTPRWSLSRFAARTSRTRPGTAPEVQSRSRPCLVTASAAHGTALRPPATGAPDLARVVVTMAGVDARASRPPSRGRTRVCVPSRSHSSGVRDSSSSRLDARTASSTAIDAGDGPVVVESPREQLLVVADDDRRSSSAISRRSRTYAVLSLSASDARPCAPSSRRRGRVGRARRR